MYKDLTPKQQEALKELAAAVFTGTDARRKRQFGEAEIRKINILKGGTYE
jgi:hypothetical protein